MYRFSVQSGQRISFDIDTPTNGPGGLGSYLRLFDSSGRQLASNNDAAAPGEQLGFDSYIQYNFSQSGTFFAGVSNWRNTSYDPNTGADAVSGSSSYRTGSYSLILQAATTIPAQPLNIAASDGVYTDKIQVTWSGATGASQYEVWRNTINSTSGAQQLRNNLTATTFDDTTAAAGTTYYYFIKARNSAGASGPSALNSGYRATAIAVDLDDQLFEAQGVGMNGAVPVSFSDTIDVATDVDMYRISVQSGQRISFDIDTPVNGPGGLGSYLRLFDASGRQLASNNDAAAPGERLGFDSYIQYDFTQSGNYFVGVSNWRNTSYDPNTGADAVSGSTSYRTGSYTLIFQASTTIPAQPLNVTASDGVFTDKIQIAWPAVTGASQYEVWRNTTNSTIGGIQLANNLTATPYDDTSAVAGTIYYYYVVARNSAGPSSPSATNSGYRQASGVTNDRFASATVLNGYSLTATGTNVGATKEIGEPNHGNVTGGKSVWWRWTSPYSGVVQIDTAGSGFDTTLSVYSGSSVAGLPLVPGGSNDDAPGLLTSKVLVNVSVGATYMIGVDGYYGAAGNISLRLAPLEISNYLLAPSSGMDPSIKVSLERPGDGGVKLPIEAGKQTWVVIHGREDNSSSFVSLARAMDAYHNNDQILTLDWSEGARDNDWGLDGAAWIDSVADWTAETLVGLGIPSSKLLVAGHSWGSFVAYEIAEKMPGKIKGLVALDPALAALGYAQTNVNFAAEADLSWAFYGRDGLYGSAMLAATAHESYVADFDALVRPGPLAAHRAPVNLFESLVQGNSLPNAHLRASMFSLARFEGAQRGPWRTDYYNSAGGTLGARRFEAVFLLLDSDGDGNWGETWSEIDSVRYYDAVHQTEWEV